MHQDDELSPFVAALRERLDTQLAIHEAAADHGNGDLVPFIEALRARLDEGLQRSVPADNVLTFRPPRLVATNLRRFVTAPVRHFSLVAAAAVAITWLWQPAWHSVSSLVGQAPEIRSQAAQHADDADTSGRASQRSSATNVESERPQLGQTTTAAAPPVALETVSSPVEAAPPSGSQRRQGESSDPQLARRSEVELAAEAWRDGNPHKAQRILRRFVSRNCSGPACEQAYADLFALAHQLGARAELITLWRDYLRRFPAGRYAEDARAGLCRENYEDNTQACTPASGTPVGSTARN